MSQSDIDSRMMKRCIELSAFAVKERELPFACVISLDGGIVAEAVNRVVRDRDVTRHAELIAISEAQTALGRMDLSGCTIYSSVEPCPMCSFPIREARISRVVYAISSPMMGGFSKWNVLGDNELSNVMPEAFGDVPEVSAGMHYREAAFVWRNWNPIIWQVIRFRGCLAESSDGDRHRTLQSRGPRRRLLRRLLALYR